MNQTPIPTQAARRIFPNFRLENLLRSTFEPRIGQRICILIDLPDASQIKDFAFLKNSELTIQKNAVKFFFEPLRDGTLAALGLGGGEMYAYKITGGSNLDLPDEAYTPDGRTVSLEKDVYPNYDIILCISTYSATAPLTAFAKKYGFRGATLHGVNQTILRTGLAVSYDDVSVDAEKMRLGMTGADWVEIDFLFNGNSHTLRLELGGQEAQKSHGLCLLSGDASVVEAHNKKLSSDPVTGELGELGFGTQVLPVSGRDIQDEKIRGTIHVATGRSDHLGGSLTPDKFAEHLNATHDDILFAPHKTSEILVTQARMHRHGETVVLIENFEPSAYINNLLA